MDHSFQLGDEERRRFAEGRGRGADSLFNDLYAELRSIAAALLRAEWRRGHTLQSIDLVNEAYLRIDRAGGQAWTNEAEFRAAAAGVMRRVLCDHARKRNRLKRGGGRGRLTLVDAIVGDRRNAIDVIMIDDLLRLLAAEDARAARVVEMRFFGGMNMDEVAQALGVSKRSVEADWTFARSWLRGRLTPDASSGVQP